MGKLAFLSLRDDNGQLQIYVDKSRLEAGQPDGFGQLKNLLDIGDIVGAKGSVKRTEKGEISVVANELGVLTKSLLPLPDKWHGLADVEKRYR
jgi:lysyl-tRNA synthetase class 2